MYNNEGGPRPLSDSPIPVFPGLGGDKGYVLAEVPAGWTFYITQSGAAELSARGVQCPAGIEMRADLAPHRSIVERVIHTLKSFRGLSNKNNIAKSGQHRSWQMMYKIACGLVNWHIDNDSDESNDQLG